jgi:carboxymethylenebutenolidase
MCFPSGSHPPLPSISGAASDEGDIHLTAEDGHRLMAYFARASEPSGNGVVVLHDGYGYRDYYKELARTFASAGIEAVAIDLYARTAHDDEGPRDETWLFRPHMEATSADTVDADVRAGMSFLRSAEGGAARSIFTLGFCFSAAYSWRQSASQTSLAGCMGMYGVPDRVRGEIANMKSPLLVIVAGADRTPISDFEAFDRELVAAEVAHRMVVYEGAPHSFYDVKFTEWKGACDDAWRQMIDFIRSSAVP